NSRSRPPRGERAAQPIDSQYYPVKHGGGAWRAELPDQFHPELNIARGVGVEGSDRGLVEASEQRVVQVVHEALPVDVIPIEQVERLGPKLDADALGDPGGLVNREVQVLLTHSAQTPVISRNIARRETGSSKESVVRATRIHAEWLHGDD